MQQVYGVAIRKGGQGKSTTVSTLARLCALYGARVLVIDLAQPGTTSASLRDIWPESMHSDLSSLLLSFQMTPPGATPTMEAVHAALSATGLPVRLTSQPSWSGGFVSVLPWDELLGDAAAFLHSEQVLSGIIAALATDIDLVLIDYPADSGPLLTNALVATNRIIIPLVAETPALEGLEAMLRLMRRARESGHEVALAGILLTRCEPRNKRVFEVVQTIQQSGEVEGEVLSRKLYPFAIRQIDFFEQAFRFGEPIWERSQNPSHWAGYVLLAERLLREAGLGQLASVRRGPTLLAPDTRILDISALVLPEPEARLDLFEKTHTSLHSS